MAFITQAHIRDLLSAPRRVPGLEQAAEIGQSGCVLFGAGGRGRQVLRRLRAAGIVPRAFADNQSSLQGAVVEGVNVHSPAEAVRLYPEAIYVVTIWSDRVGHPLAAVRVQLEALGARRVVSFTALYEWHPEAFLPDFFLDRHEAFQGQEPAIWRAANLWAEAASGSEFLAQLALRLDLDFSRVAGGVDYPAYFPPDLFALSPDESLVDCGAFDGDTYRDFRRVSGGRFARYIALEPDAGNFAKLTEEVGAEAQGAASRARLLEVGVSETEKVVRFSAAGTAESRADAGGSNEIHCLPLDQILREEKSTYIKMDIEGAEADALRGARVSLARDRPILAVSVYHKVTDLWELPLLISSMVRDYVFHLRPEKKAGWDLVCYAIPRERALFLRP